MRGGDAIVAIHPFGQAEIGDIGFAITVDQNVGRLQITMQNAALMSVVQGTSYLSHQAGCRSPIMPEKCQVLRERAAFYQLHGEVKKAIPFAHFINGNDVRVIEVSDRFCLGSEPCQRIRPGILAANHHLEGNEPIKLDVPGAKNQPHASSTQLGEVSEAWDVRCGRNIFQQTLICNISGRTPDGIAKT